VLWLWLLFTSSYHIDLNVDEVHHLAACDRGDNTLSRGICHSRLRRMPAGVRSTEY